MLKAIVFGLGLLSASLCWAQEAFIPGTEDVPLAEGLTLIAADSDISFDTPAGQIFSVEASSTTLDTQSVQTFYDKTMPALGWQQTALGVYEREAETLRVSVVQEKPLVVRFELSPRDF